MGNCSTKLNDQENCVCCPPDQNCKCNCPCECEDKCCCETCCKCDENCKDK